MKLSKWIIGGVAVIAAAITGVCYAGSFTTHGVTTTSTTLTDTSNATKDLNVLDDYSEYPRYLGRHGTIIRTYRFSEMGGTTATAVQLDTGHVINYIPDNTVIWDGFVQVTEGVDPAGTTIALGVNVANDILTATTNLNGIGFYQITPVGTTATAVQATNNMPFKSTFAVSSPTSGVFTVYMDCYLAQ